MDDHEAKQMPRLPQRKYFGIPEWTVLAAGCIVVVVLLVLGSHRYLLRDYGTVITLLLISNLLIALFGGVALAVLRRSRGWAVLAMIAVVGTLVFFQLIQAMGLANMH